MGKKLRRNIWIGGLGLLAVFVLSLLIYINRISSHFAEFQIERLLHTHVEFSDLEFDLLRMGVSLRNLTVYHPEDPEKIIAQVKKLSVRSLGNPLNKKMYQIEIILDRPEINFITNRKGEWELSGMVPLMRRGKGEARLNPLNVENITVKDGRILFEDGRVKMTTQITHANLKLKHLCLPTQEEKYPSEFKANMVVAGSKMSLVGKGDFLSSKTSLQAQWTVTGFPLPPYTPYYDHGLPVRIQRGVASFSSSAKIMEDRLNIPIHARINGLNLELKRKSALQEFGSDLAVKSLTNEKGQVELDLLVKGNLKRPFFAVLTDFKKAAMAGLTQPFQKAGNKIKEGTKSGFRKVKNFFSGN